MPPGLKIRDGGPADAGSLTAIFLGARAGMPYLPCLHTDAETRWWMANVVLAGHAVRVAEAAGRVVGFSARSGELLAHLYVDPAAQGAGIGSALLADAQMAAPALRLFVFAANAGAVSLYRRHGFAVIGRSDGSRNEEGLPDVEMEWAASGHEP
ncbi:N-acetyltransferase [Allostella sp. ATCC 35155]|nr:N-acetyltransferase [Stella sp. ATCC 35155]